MMKVSNLCPDFDNIFVNSIGLKWNHFSLAVSNSRYFKIDNASRSPSIKSQFHDALRSIYHVITIRRDDCKLVSSFNHVYQVNNTPAYHEQNFFLKPWNSIVATPLLDNSELRKIILLKIFYFSWKMKVNHCILVWFIVMSIYVR